MAIEVTPLPNGAGARILGADLSRPIGESDFADIYAAYLEWSNILIPGQDHISPAHYQAFCARFGKIMPGIPSTGRQKRYRKTDVERAHVPTYTLAGHPGIFVLTNEEIDGKPAGLSKAGLYWHSDLYYREVPAKVTFLLAKRVPRSGGATGILNMYLVYDAMPDALKRRIAGLRVWHSWVAGWSSLFPTRAPLTDEEIADTPGRHPPTGMPASREPASYALHRRLVPGSKSGSRDSRPPAGRGAGAVREAQGVRAAPGVRLHPPLAGRRSPGERQHLGHALRDAVRRHPRHPHAPSDHNRGRASERHPESLRRHS